MHDAERVDAGQPERDDPEVSLRRAPEAPQHERASGAAYREEPGGEPLPAVQDEGAHRESDDAPSRDRAAAARRRAADQRGDGEQRLGRRGHDEADQRGRPSPRGARQVERVAGRGGAQLRAGVWWARRAARRRGLRTLLPRLCRRAAGRRGLRPQPSAGLRRQRCARPGALPGRRSARPAAGRGAPGSAAPRFSRSAAGSPAARSRPGIAGCGTLRPPAASACARCSLPVLSSVSTPFVSPPAYREAENHEIPGRCTHFPYPYPLSGGGPPRSR